MAASLDCARARTPLEHLICSDPPLRRWHSRMEGALKQRLAELPEDASVALLKQHSSDIRGDYSYCSESSDHKTTVSRRKITADCLAGLYRREINNIRAECKIDTSRTIEDFITDKFFVKGHGFYRQQQTIPKGFIIVSGPRSYKISERVGSVVIRILPSMVPAKPDFDSLLGGGAKGYALCAVRSPSGTTWLVIGGPPSGLLYILAKNATK